MCNNYFVLQSKFESSASCVFLRKSNFENIQIEKKNHPVIFMIME